MNRVWLASFSLHVWIDRMQAGELWDVLHVPDSEQIVSDACTLINPACKSCAGQQTLPRMTCVVQLGFRTSECAVVTASRCITPLQFKHAYQMKTCFVKDSRCSVCFFQVVGRQWPLHEQPTEPAATDNETKSLYTACVSDLSGWWELCGRRGQSHSSDHTVHFVRRNAAITFTQR